MLAELEADDDEGPNTSKQRSPTLSSDEDILDKVGIGKIKLFTAPLDENSDNESASQPKPPTLLTTSFPGSFLERREAKERPWFRLVTCHPDSG